MQALKHSAVSLLPVPPALSGFDLAQLDLTAALERQLLCDVLLVQWEDLKSPEFEALWHQISQDNRGARIILFTNQDTKVTELLSAHRRFPIYKICANPEATDLQSWVLEAIEKSNWIRQDEQLEVLVRDQYEKLRYLYTDLEDRVEKRQRFLEESRRKSVIAQFRWSTLRKATEAIHSASSVGEIERNLTHVLKDSLSIVQLRITLMHQSTLAQSDRLATQLAVYRVRLFHEPNSYAGYCIYFRDEAWPFSTDEKDFLQKIAEVVSLAIRRLNQLEISTNLREQWQTTFNAVGDPVALINRDYDVVQSNSAFGSKAAAPSAPQKCYRLLFGRDQPCTNCNLGRGFRYRHRVNSASTETGSAVKWETWAVHSQALQLSSDADTLYFNQYHEITEQVRLEQRLLEGARLAELGIIGSSIAHELNNPLGGILTFVQMMKMDLPPNDPLESDLTEMEQGVLRCRDIVQNLLGFTRDSQDKELTPFDLRQALQRALTIIDLQTRSHGIAVRRELPEEPMWIMGRPNLITQAIANILQESTQSALQNAGKLTPHLEIVAHSFADRFEIHVLDNGPGADAIPRISLPLAQQIVLDHDGQVEVHQPSKGLRLVKIVLPKVQA